MKIYNTLTREIEDFVPLNADIVKIYTCGPTVYDKAHIGNLSSYIYADVLRRVLNLENYKTKHVMNITDVDDKTIRRSVEKYPSSPAKDALKQLTEEIYQTFLNDMKSVGNDVDSIEFIRATDSIEAIQKLILLLIEAKAAYIADDGIYFDVKRYSKDHKYGQLSKIELLDEMKSRINNDEYDKDSAQDFVLWKAEKPNEPSWDFEVNGQNMPGRPGWHIECSAMSVSKLGQPFDVHTGGVDLIFPHHENEIAQSTAGGQPDKLAKYFFHNNMLLVDGKKMAKSANNFYTLYDIEKKGYASLDFRMMILQSHYQTTSNFSWDNIDSAHNRLMKWRAVSEMRHQIPQENDNDPLNAIVANLLSEAEKSLTNNLATPEALKFLDKIVDILNDDSYGYSFVAINAFVSFVDQNLGLQLAGTTPDISDNVKEMIQMRSVLRANGDYKKSDGIRDSLLAQGIQLNDISIGVVWSRI